MGPVFDHATESLKGCLGQDRCQLNCHLPTWLEPPSARIFPYGSLLILAIMLRRYRVAKLAGSTDQRIGGRVVLQLWLGSRLELGNDPGGEHLSQLDAPLIEGIDVPDRALGEHLVLVHPHHLA